jgi:Domain of unknown function (DUF6484)
MKIEHDPFEVIATHESADDFAILSRRPATSVIQPLESLPGVSTARLHGFDFNDQPLITGSTDLATEIYSARTTINLSRSQVGATVAVLFDQGDRLRPIIVGVLQQQRRLEPNTYPEQVEIQADNQRFLVSAEQEIVLRCGEASITLTRAGKVIIKGTYILSSSAGYNKIKGAAVDIN